MIQGNFGKFMVDSGATRSFLSKTFADNNNIPTRPLQKVEVRLADNKLVHHSGIVPKLRCKLGTYVFTLNRVMVLPCLEDEDLILGMDWLHRSNPSIDWVTRSIYVRDKEHVPHVIEPKG